MPDRFTVLAEGLHHPEGVAWDPVGGRVVAGGEGGELYGVSLDGDVDLAACRERGILQVRIVHGKGTGALHNTLLALLATLPEVASFRTATEEAGGWGATLVELRPPTLTCG